MTNLGIRRWLAIRRWPPLLLAAALSADAYLTRRDLRLPGPRSRATYLAMADGQRIPATLLAVTASPKAPDPPWRRRFRHVSVAAQPKSSLSCISAQDRVQWCAALPVLDC